MFDHISNEQKITLVDIYQNSKHDEKLLKQSLSHMTETEASDAKALYESGYRVEWGSRVPTHRTSELSNKHEYIATSYFYAGWTATNEHHVCKGLYRIENMIAGERHDLLSQVMTASEVAEHYKINADMVRVSIHKNYIPARKSGGTWLILRADAEKRWGDNQS